MSNEKKDLVDVMTKIGPLDHIWPTKEGFTVLNDKQYKAKIKKLQETQDGR